MSGLDRPLGLDHVDSAISSPFSRASIRVLQYHHVHNLRV